MPQPAVRADPDRLLSRLCRGDFRRFVREFWDAVPGAAPLKWNWHMDVLCVMAQGLAERVFAGLPKLADYPVNVPPGTSKSSLLTILFPAWLWTRMPQCRVICASHTSELVLDLAVKSRAVIQSEKYRRLFPGIDMAEDVDTKGLFRNTHGGDRYSCTVAGKSPIGFHAHVIVIDDPLDPKKALSEVEKAAARHFMEEVIESRKVDKAVTPTLLVMQRLGPGDPTDVMLDAAARPGGTPVDHHCLPAELTDDVRPPALKGSYQGGLLDPARMPKHVLDQIRSRNQFAYATQYLQKPTLPGGGMFKAKDFKYARVAPYESKRVFYVDRASSLSPGACFTAGVLMARAPNGDYYVEDVVHGRWEPDERNEVVRAACLKYRRRYGPRHEPRIYVEAEGGSSGVDAWKGVVKALSGFAVRQDRVTGSKDVRAEPFSTAVAGGVVWLVDGGQSEGLGRPEWDVDGFVTELVRFKPDVTKKRLGGLKDRTDAASGAYSILADARQAGTVLRSFTLGERKKGQLRVVATHAGALPALRIDRPTLLVVLCQPGERPAPPPHAIDRLTAWHPLPAADVDLAEVTDWSQPVTADGLAADQAALSRDEARRLWGFLTRRHDPPTECVVFCGSDELDRRPLSAAYGYCDALRLPRDGTLIVPGDDERRHNGAPPPNVHYHDAVRLGRAGA